MISVLTLTYKRKDLLEEAIQSFLVQKTNFETEMVVVNDCSEVHYNIDAKNVRVLNVPKRFSSISKKIEWGYKQCKYNYVYRLDDDDLIAPDGIQNLYNSIINNPEFEIYRGKQSYLFHGHKYIKPVGNVNNGNVYTKSYLDRITFGDSSFGEDAHITFSFGAKIYHMDVPIMIYRWATGHYHVSGLGNIKPEELNKKLDNFTKKDNYKGLVKLNPNFKSDYYSQLTCDNIECEKCNGTGKVYETIIKHERDKIIKKNTFKFAKYTTTTPKIEINEKKCESCSVDIKPIMNKVRLFQQEYVDQNPERNMELEFCLHKNKNLIFDSIDYEFVPIKRRITFNEFFQMSRNYPNSINILANTDIFLKKETVEKIVYFYSKLKKPEKFCLAMSRWEFKKNGEASTLAPPDSQDVWVFYGSVPIMENADFFVGGVLGCDNRIAHILVHNGFIVENPALSIKFYHYHLSGVRNYNKSDRIYGDYHAVYGSTMEHNFKKHKDLFNE